MFAAVVGFCLLTGQAPVSPEAFLQRGRDEYRAGRYAEAANDLKAAADALLSPEQMKTFVSTGQFASLPQFETAIIYLTLADVKLGREADAREQLERLQVAEGIAPTYASLALTSEVADFPAVAKRLLPSLQLPGNANVAAGTPAGRVPAQEPAPAPAPTSATTAAAPAPAIEAVSEAQQRYIDQKIAEARAEIEHRAQERIDAIQKAAQEQIAAARAQAAASTQTAPARIEGNAGIVTALHKAAVQANTGQVEQANAVYLQLATAAGAPRDVIAAAAVGLYRTGDFADALRAFEKLGTFARGEEDLRYYKAVSLFETGRYEEAKKELDCALPYIEMTDDVARYQTKIEQMLSTRRSAGSSS